MPSYKKFSNRALCLILAFVVAMSMTACSTRDDDDLSSQSARSAIPEFSIAPPEEVSVSDKLPEDFPEVQDLIDEMYAINDETVGWLYIPNTTINDVVVCRQDPADYNRYYLRRDIYRTDGIQEGIYYADCRDTFDGGDINALSRNTTIYGHSIEIPDNDNGIRFSQLKKYWDEDFAREHPYIYFSLEGRDLVWEIFAAYYTKSTYIDKVNEYINPLDNYTTAEIQSWLDRMIERSEYIYDVDVSTKDKFLTLSTCVYHPANNQYPNDYRWVITAKLVQDGKYKEEASLKINPNIKSMEAQH